MQKSIDAFFKRVPAGAAPSTPKPEAAPAKRKRKALVISSDEEEIPESPQVSAKTKKETKKSRTDSTPEKAHTKNAKKPTLSKLNKSPKGKAIDPASLFGTEIMRVEKKRPSKPKDASELELEDDEINQSLMDIDYQEPSTSTTAQRKSPRKSPHHLQATPAKTNGDHASKQEMERKTPGSAKKTGSKTPLKSPRKTPEKRHEKTESAKKSTVKAEKVTPAKKPQMRRLSEEDDNEQPVKQEKRTPTSAKKPKLKPLSEVAEISKEKHAQQTSPSTKKTKKQLSNEDEHEEEKPKKQSKTTPRAKKQPTNLDGSILSDEERHERKRMAAVLYQKFKNRSSCLNHGCKEVPKGKPNCLAGLTFLVTGVLESLERDEAASIVKEYGGKVMTTVGKRLNYLIAGEDAGPKKLADAEELHIKVINEDEFFDLIREKSGDAAAKTNGDVKAEKLLDEKPSTSAKIKKEKSERPEEKHTVSKQVKREPEQSMETNIIKNKIKQEQPLPPTTAAQAKPAVSEELLAWVDKYKPSSVKEIIGQQGAASNVTKLMNWLSKWYVNHDGKKKLQKPNPWAKNDDGSFYKAALLSGPPGIGKTTTATLVCKELGFDVVEFNASDTRSKKLLKEEVAELLSNKSLYGYFHGNAQAVSKKHVLIMDEVDGMAGNEDRGGIQELIGLIKESSVPIICMCNDRNHQKMRSLVNYCYDLRFNKPRLEQIKALIMSICFKEKIKVDKTKVEEIIAATNNDIRQSINHIALLSAGKELQLKSDQANSDEKTATKDLKMGPWDVVRKVFSADEHKQMSFYDKCDLFFHDYSLAPLFVQQNYLIVAPAVPKAQVLQRVAAAADALSLGDLVDKRIRSNAAWTLLPTQGIFSSVMPGYYMSGHFTGQINFPGWLGKNSRATKRSRLAQEIHDHTRLRTSGSRLSVRLDYAPFLLDKIVRPLRERGADGVHESLAVMQEYHLLREDIESLIELTAWPGKKSAMDAVDGKVKAALTRAYNKETLAYTYSAQAGVKKKKAEASEDAESLAIEGEEAGEVVAVDSEDSDADNLENDGLIKAKKKTAAASSKASTSKAASSGAKKAPAKGKPKK